MWSFLLCIVLLLSNVKADDGWFWHVTDFHYDPTYLDDALSCEKNASERGMFGYNWCDSPWSLIQSSINAMHEIKPDVDFLIWTGDSSPHIKDALGSHEMYRDIVANITRLLRSTFNSTQVYPAFGNHDYFPAHQFPPNNNRMYNEIYEEWKDWIQSDTQKANFLKGGYYSLKTATGIRMMVLNTNLYYRSDKVSWLYRYSDPADQFQWMAETLESSKNNNESVIIMSHVPPGVLPTEKTPWMYPQFNHRFNTLLVDYSEVIAGAYFGHEHVDNWGLYYKAGVPVLVRMCAPSVTPWTYIRPNGEAEPTRNPAIRLVKYDRTTGKAQEITQYYLDIQTSNEKKTAKWTVEYTLPQDYHMKDLAPQSFHELVQRMKNPHSPDFENYAKRRYINGANDDIRVASCSSMMTCKKSIICSLTNANVRDFDFCDSDGFDRVPPVG